MKGPANFFGETKMKVILALGLVALCFVNTTMAAKTRKVASATSGTLACHGSEPFWNATIALDERKGAGSLVMDGDGWKNAKFPKIKAQRAMNDGNVSFLKGWANGKALYASLTNMGNRETPCTGEGEGPENEYPFELHMMLGDKVYVGCCR